MSLKAAALVVVLIALVALPPLAEPYVLHVAIVVLINAVYFHGDWRWPFLPMSAEETFHAPGGPVSVPMMTRYDLELPQWSGAGYRAATMCVGRCLQSPGPQAVGLRQLCDRP